MADDVRTPARMNESAGSRYARILERIFSARYSPGMREVPFQREDIVATAAELGIATPKNLGDLIYSFRYRNPLPTTIAATAPANEEWSLRSAGSARYRFVLGPPTAIVPNALLAETKIPDATPGVVAMYALSDEQALLARLRYNRFIDIFTGIACYPLQSHLRTHVAGIGQIETDEVYVGIDRLGVQYVLPVQAKGGSDALNLVQIEQDVAMCEAKFPALNCRPIAAQFMADDVIALFGFEPTADGPRLLREAHYRLVPAEEITPLDLTKYQMRQ